MRGNRNTIAAWSAGVSAAVVGVAGLFAAGKTPLDRLVFRGLTIIGVVLILLGTAIRRPPWAPSLTVDEVARKLAKQRSRQVRHLDPMPVCWEMTDAARQAMPSGLARGELAASQLLPLTGEFRTFGSAFARMRPPRIVIIGESGAGKTTLVSKLFLYLTKKKKKKKRAKLGLPVSIPAVQWAADEDVAQAIAAQLKVTHARASEALEEGKIFPVIEDLDGLAPPLRVEAIKKINSLPPDIPLLVTSRPKAYFETIEASESPIRNAAAVELRPLEIADVKPYLNFNMPPGTGSRWAKVCDFLPKPDGAPLARVLTNPLMLWLAREIYKRKETDPTELTKVSRFGDHEAIEDHLLDQLIPQKFADDYAGQDGRPWRHRWTGGQAQRWLEFLAAGLDKIRSQDIAWWRLPEMVPAGRPATFALRGAILTTAAWYASAWAVHRLGGWRNAIDPALLLRGPLGQQIVPIWTHLPTSFLHDENRSLPALISAVIGFIPHPLLLLELCAILVAIANGALHALFDIRHPGGATGYHISTTHIRLRNVLVAAGFTLGGTVLIGGILAGVVIAAMQAMHRNERSKFFASLLHVGSGGALLLIIFLWLLTDIMDPFATERLEISRLPSPDKALRQQRRHTLLIILWERISRLVLSWLVFGPVIALAYGSYEIGAVLCRITLGGRQSASDVFDDARFWLACTRRLPWRVMTFLTEAEHLGILRPIGGVYQFRHIRLQQRLSRQYMLLSRRMTAAAVPAVRCCRRRLSWRRLYGGWWNS